MELWKCIMESAEVQGGQKTGRRMNIHDLITLKRQMDYTETLNYIH